MKAGFIISGVLVLIITGLVWARQRIQSPEQLIVGSWREQAWEYERVHARKDLEKLRRQEPISQVVKDQLGKHLIIHSAEQWLFRPNGILVLQGASAKTEVKWKIKGRGHILELEYHDHMIEHYNLTELTSEQMVLNFDSDMQVRGVAKLTFKR
ncbi:MAG TPA: hypothetical protein VIN08_02530 [Ohtaekwangia sp.]|uniref:hypothetical protein n=1 Tax=Ohtaekwangia sp. TaxID=2066019 RepID=UPI002F92AE8C